MKNEARIFYSAVDGQFYPFTGNPEKARRFEAAGMVTPTDVSEVTTVTVLDEVIGMARPDYNLRQACRVIPMDTLELRVDKSTNLTADEKVGALVESPIADRTRSTINFSLWKNVVHVVAEDEAQKRSAHNELQLSIGDAAGALANSENSQIKTILEAGTATSAGSDWGTVTSGRSANDPYADIGTAEDVIRGTNGFKPDTLLAAPKTWREFFSNDFVKGQLQGTVQPDFTKPFPIPGMPGYKGISDYAITNTIMMVLDSKQAAMLGDGPTTAERYRNPTAGFDGYIIRKWLEPKIAIEEAIYRLTAVRA